MEHNVVSVVRMIIILAIERLRNMRPRENVDVFKRIWPMLKRRMQWMWMIRLRRRNVVVWRRKKRHVKG